MVKVKADSPAGTKEFNALMRIDTPKEIEYFQHGGIIPYVIRQILQG